MSASIDILGLHESITPTHRCSPASVLSDARGDAHQVPSNHVCGKSRSDATHSIQAPSSAAGSSLGSVAHAQKLLGFQSLKQLSKKTVGRLGVGWWDAQRPGRRLSSQLQLNKRRVAEISPGVLRRKPLNE